MSQWDHDADSHVGTRQPQHPFNGFVQTLSGTKRHLNASNRQHDLLSSLSGATKHASMVHNYRVTKRGPKLSPYFSKFRRLADKSVPFTTEAQQPTDRSQTSETMTRDFAQGIRAIDPRETIVVDASGDLTLICSTKTFLVDKHVLRRSSRLLASLTDGVTVAIAAVAHQTAALHSNEDPEALEILLNIMHLNFSEVPSDLRLETLARLTRLCDKYGTLQLLKPFQEGWIKRHDIGADDVGMGNTRIAALAAVSWTLGLHTVFQRIALNQLQQAIVQSNQHDFQLVIRRYIFGNDRCEWVDWAVSMVPVLTQVYQEALELLLHIFLDTFDYLSSEDFKCVMPEEQPGSSWRTWDDPPGWSFSGSDNYKQRDRDQRCKVTMLRDYLSWISELKRGVGIAINMTTRKVETSKGVRLVDIFECHQRARMAFDATVGHDECHVGGLMLNKACKVLHGIPARIRELHQAWITERDQVQVSRTVAPVVVVTAPAGEGGLAEEDSSTDSEMESVKQEHQP